MASQELPTVSNMDAPPVLLAVQVRSPLLSVCHFHVTPRELYSSHSQRRLTCTRASGDGVPLETPSRAAPSPRGMEGQSPCCTLTLPPLAAHQSSLDFDLGKSLWTQQVQTICCESAVRAGDPETNAGPHGAPRKGSLSFTQTALGDSRCLSAWPLWFRHIRMHAVTHLTVM